MALWFLALLLGCLLDTFQSFDSPSPLFTADFSYHLVRTQSLVRIRGGFDKSNLETKGGASNQGTQWSLSAPRSFKETFDFLVSEVGLNAVAELDDIVLKVYNIEPAMIKTLRLMAVGELTETRHNQRMQEEEARQKTLLLECRVKDSVLLSFRDLIDSALPPYQFIAKIATTSTVAALRLEPVAVRRWAEFESCVREHRKCISPWTLNFTPLPPAHFKEMDCDPQGIHQCQSEVEIYGVFKGTVCRALDQLFNFSIKTSMPENVGSSSITSEGSRREDFVSKRIRRMSVGPGDLQSQSDETARKVVAVWEIKSDSLHKYGFDLVSCFNTSKSRCPFVDEVIYQHAGHHVVTNCKYGFISTYKSTWATCLAPSGILYISDPFFDAVTGPLSVLNMAYYLLCRADRELDNVSSPYVGPKLKPAPIRKYRRRSGTSANQTKQETRAGRRALQAGKGIVGGLAAVGAVAAFKLRQRLTTNSKRRITPNPKAGCSNHVDLTILRVMINHHDRITFQARLDDLTVALKCYANANVRDRESICYEKLESLQGISIPTLVEGEFDFPDDRQGRRHGIVLSWIGSLYGGNYMVLPTKALLIAREVVNEMHKHGVAHGDIRAENMNYNFTTSKLFVYDFSHAVVDTLDGEEAFQEACEEDDESLHKLIEWSKSEEGQNVQYIHWQI